MRVALLVPCYVDQLWPQVGLATLEVLERFGVEVEFPTEQTCCGQPLLNLGCFDEARPLARRAAKIFAPFEYVVCPSASCTAMLRQQYGPLLAADGEAQRVAGRTYELCEFLTDVLGVERVGGRFAHRVGLLQGCHGVHELRLGGATEHGRDEPGKVARLLQTIGDLELARLDRPDECCGFGGTFAVGEEAVSCAMGRDRLGDHERAGVEVLTSTDASCLMHLDGLVRRERRNLRTMHVAELFVAARPRG